MVAQLGEFPVVDVGFALGAGGPGGGWLMLERPGRDARAGLWEAGAVVRPAGSDGVGLSSTGALSVDGLTWLGARVYDPATRSFLSRDPLPPVLGAGWAANPYSWAGNDPVNLADPSGAHPLTDAEMEAWRDAHKTGLAAVGDYLADNWQYIVGGIVLGTVLTAACGPVLGGALTGAIISGWQNVDQQVASGGPFDVGGFARAVVLGGASGAIGGAVAEGVAGTALARGMGCLGRSTFVGGVSGTVAGGFDGAAGYLTGPGPHTVGGFLGATGGGAVFGGFTGAGVGALSSVTDVSRFGCFPAGTRVLMADGTAKPIEDVEAGDRVASVDPDTGRPATATVTATFTHRDVDALRITTDRGELVTTAAHPLYAQGRGFVPAGDLRPGDVLRDADGPAARVIRVRPAGRARTVHNIEVDTTHAYYVATTTGTWTLAHNGCTWDSRVSRWRDTETGRFRTTPTRFSELVNKGRINYDDVNQLATQNKLTNHWTPPADPSRFVDGGFKYQFGGETAWGHGPDSHARAGWQSYNQSTARISRPVAPNTLGQTGSEYIHTDESWSSGSPSTSHLPMDNSPYKK